MHTKGRVSWIKRRAVTAAGIAAAVALAAPVAEANAATPAVATPTLAALPTLPAFPFPAFTPGSLSFVIPPVAPVGAAIGPTVIGSVFNGGTTVCVSTLATACSTNASP